MEIEKRSDSVHLSGYVNAVGRESRVLCDKDGEFIEVIEPRTFARALEMNGNNVGLMFNHSRDLSYRSLELVEDEIGLKVDMVTDDPEVMQKADKGELRGWSFGFNNCTCEWSTRDDGMRIRHVRGLNLIEISLLDITPAYTATTVEKRSNVVPLELYKLKLDFMKGIE